jgi:hypothetical protein
VTEAGCSYGFIISCDDYNSVVVKPRMSKIYKYLTVAKAGHVLCPRICLSKRARSPSVVA